MFFNQFIIDLARRLDQKIAILVRLFESNQGIHFLVQITVSWGEAVAESVQYPEVDLVGSVRIGREPIRLDVGGVVIQDIENIMTFVLMRADDLGVDGYMIRHQSIRGHALLQAKIFRGISRVDRIDLRFHALTIAA